RRVGHARDHVEVAGRAASPARLALAGQANTAAVLHTGRDVDPVALDLLRLARPVAGRARLLDLRAGAAAPRARLRDREQPLPLRLDAAALAARADRRLRAGLGARAVAGGARRRQAHADGHLRALHRLLERDVDIRFEISPALGTRSAARAGAAGAEQVGEDVADPAEAAEAATAAAEGVRVEARAEDPAARVVALALVGVGQDGVRLLDLLEALLGRRVARVLVRVVLPRELAVGLLDLVV